MTLCAQTLPAATGRSGCPRAEPARWIAGGGRRCITAAPPVWRRCRRSAAPCRTSCGPGRLHAARIIRALRCGGRQARARVRHGVRLHPPPLAFLAGARFVGTLVGVQRQWRERRAQWPQPAQEWGCLRGAQRGTAAATAGLLGRQIEGRVELLVKVGGLRKEPSCVSTALT